MSQVTDFDIPASPLTMSALATALEAIFAALGSINRGATAPSNPFEGMLGWDSTAAVEILKRYTVTAGWVSILSVDRTTGALAIIGATDAATVSTLMQRDSAGRAKVVAPSVAADIALKSTVTADIATHDALVTAHGTISGSDTPGGNFVTGTIYWDKFGSLVTISWTDLGHGSAVSAASAAVIPSALRPGVTIYNTVLFSDGIVTRATVTSAGVLNAGHFNNAGTATAATNLEPGSVTYRVA